LIKNTPPISSAHTQLSNITHFLLLPIKSGYRQGEKQRLVLTTHYDEAYTEIQANEPDNYIEVISDFGVVIPISEVLTASLYREDVHSKYFPHSDRPILLE